MSANRNNKEVLKPYDLALARLREHFLLAPVMERIYVYRVTRFKDKEFSKSMFCQVQDDTSLYYNDALKLSPEQWCGVLSVAVLVLCVGGPKRFPEASRAGILASQIAALYWWADLKIGELPESLQLPPEVIALGRYPLEEIARRIETTEPEPWMEGRWSLAGPDGALFVWTKTQSWNRAGTWAQTRPTVESIFAQSLVNCAKRALQEQHKASLGPAVKDRDPNSIPAQAKRWLISHFPLLGGLLTQFELVEDAEVCERLDISVAAIQISTGEIFINPRRQLNLREAIFVVAHEVLHAGLNHSSRREGREPYLWNIACDFVINDWLVGMNVGTPPDIGMLFDENLRGRSAEDIYGLLAIDLRIRRKLCTLRGHNVDMLDERSNSRVTDFEEFCRRALLQGLDYHQGGNRGTLPAGLVEAIRTLNQPPIPWQVQLSQWIQEHFPLPERKRTWAKPSRRQSSMPDIPRPRYIAPQEVRPSHTFGVVVDTSGSMERDDLGKALGAIVAYAQAQEVKEIRLVYCDAEPYDEGYVAVVTLAERVRVRGRGGTVLQPAIDLLLTRQDFPRDCPVLIITDGYCEEDLLVRRDHAFLLAPGGRLPFATIKPVFRMK